MVLKNSFSKIQSILDYKMDKKKQNILFIAELTITFLMVFALNTAQPLFTDDWEYSFLHRLYDCSNKGIITDERISSITDIFSSQYEHYFTWGGRSVNHFIAQLLLFIGTPYNKILNSLAYVALVYAIYLFSRKRGEELKPSLFLLINILIFFFQPVLGSTILWITGSSNYLWGTLILLLFLLPYKNLYETGTNKKNNATIKAIYMFPFGVIAGWTNENMAAMMIFTLIVFFIYLKKGKQSIPIWFYSGFLGTVIGFLLMISAPGNFLRYEITLQENGLENLSKIQLLLNQFTVAVSGIFFYLLPIISLYLITFVLYKYYGKHNTHKDAILSLSFFIAALLATLAMTFSPVFPERAWFGIIIFIIMAISRLYNSIDFGTRFIQELKTVILTLAFISMLGYYISGYKDLSKAKKVFDKREQIITEQKSLGKLDFIFEEEIKSKSKINNLYDLTSDPNHWKNCFYARYYGINSVTVINK